MKKKFYLAFSALLLSLYALFPFSIASLPSKSDPLRAFSYAPTATHVVLADDLPSIGDYAYIPENNVYFYATPTAYKGVFLLPKTYYVRLLDYQTDFCKIEYLYDDVSVQKLVGYVKTEQVYFVDYVPKRPYLYYLFDVQYTIGDSSFGDSAFLDKLTVSCAYYGDYRIGSQTYCYVLREGTFGYIPKPDALSFEENTEYADYLAAQTPPDSSTTESNDASPYQIAVLIALCLLVPVLAALILKPPKKPPYDVE